MTTPEQLDTYNVEITDTYGGEANYSWVRRYTFEAPSLRSAVQQLAVAYDTGWRKDWDNGDTARYNHKYGHICAFITRQEQ